MRSKRIRPAKNEPAFLGSRSQGVVVVMPKLTVIGSLKDSTTAYVVSKMIESAIEFDYVDVSRVIESGKWELVGSTLVFKLPDQNIVLNDNSRVFYRYIPLDRVIGDEEKINKFFKLTRDLHLALRERVAKATTIPGNAFHNFSKPLHQIIMANLAEHFEIYFPDAILSNSAAELSAFAEAWNFDVIAKGVSGGKTWALGLDEQSFRERLRYQSNCPTFMQRRIRGWDCRVHTVETSNFAEAIISDHADYRRKSGTTFKPVQLPLDVAAFCERAARISGVLFAGIDFKVDVNDRWYFLELNSMPCFQGYDRRAKGKISKALFSALAN